MRPEAPIWPWATSVGTPPPTARVAPASPAGVATRPVAAPSRPGRPGRASGSAGAAARASARHHRRPGQALARGRRAGHPPARVAVTAELEGGPPAEAVAVIGLVALLLQVPVASLADRGNRVRIATLGAAAWGVFSLLTGLATGIVALAASASVGRGQGGRRPHPQLAAGRLLRHREPRPGVLVPPGGQRARLLPGAAARRHCWPTGSGGARRSCSSPSPRWCWSCSSCWPCACVNPPPACTSAGRWARTRTRP